ncbi:response regulator [Halobacillus fulvus]|nr:response regulator [Halobacillus fulvus]
MSRQPDIKVALIEDDPMVQEVNRQFIEAVRGFKVEHMAADGDQGVDLVKKYQPDLVVLDIYMPGQDGLSTLAEIRKEGMDVDVIVITAANDKDTIRTMLQYGALDYIVKPFKFERLKHALENYRNYYSSMYGKGELNQRQIDGLVATQMQNAESELPKGLNRQTLQQIVSFLRSQTDALSAEEVADGVGLARVTARRYLDYLQKQGNVEIAIQYGGIGRPVNRYQMSEGNS